MAILYKKKDSSSRRDRACRGPPLERAPAAEGAEKPTNELEKKLRNLKKKLKQVEELEAKAAAGEELAANQKEKIDQYVRAWSGKLSWAASRPNVPQYLRQNPRHGSRSDASLTSRQGRCTTTAL